MDRNELMMKLDNIRQMIGEETLMNELANWMSTDDLKDFVDNLVRNWDLDEE